MNTKKRAKKSTSKKVEEKIVYLPLDTPMSEGEVVSAFSIPQDDPLRRAIDQTLKKMRDEANSIHPQMCDNHGKLAYSTGYEQGILDVLKELDKCYAFAKERLSKSHDDAEQPKTLGY
jgi:hypothetical protein